LALPELPELDEVTPLDPLLLASPPEALPEVVLPEEVLTPEASGDPGSPSAGTGVVEQAKAKIATQREQGRIRMRAA
jgi:hypothetical protein